MRLFTASMVLVAVAVASVACDAGWGTGCPPVGGFVGQVFQNTPAPLQWREHAGNPSQVFLYRGNLCIGGYDYPQKLYRPWAQGVWFDPCEPPVAAPEQSSTLPTGVETDKLTGKQRYMHGQKEVSKAEAFRVIEKDFPDDRTKPHLTLIGDKEACATVKAKCGDLIARVRYQDYRPEDWQVKGCGYEPGNPSVYLQSPSGKVLWREAGDVSVEAIRKRIDDYDAKKDPGPAGQGSSIPPIAWIGGGLALLALYSRKETK